MKKGLLILLIMSVVINIFQFGRAYWIDRKQPTKDDHELLGEMVNLVVNSKDYKELAEKETIYSIMPRVEKQNDEFFPFNYDIVVSTDQKGYVFTCMTKECTEMEIGGWTHSRYTEYEPVLPFQDENAYEWE